MSDQLAQINNAAHQGAFGHNPRSEPTLAQLAAGNYKKGVVMVKGLSIAIENPAYTYRKGIDKTGQQWMCLMQAHYGYIQGHKGNDGDEMDVFIGNVPENDTVYIVNQKTADGYFDEHKIMLGFLSQQQAVDTYQHCFERGWTGLMSVVPCTMTQFKWWLANGDKSRPVTLDRLPYAGLERLDSVIWGGNDGSDLASHSGQVHKLLYQIRQCDDTHQALEPLSYNDLVQELGNQGFMYENYDALVVEYNKLEKKAKQLLLVMQGAASTVKPMGVTVGKPLTKGGVANVVAWFEMDDGQAVGVFFHNPDKTPKKIDPTDEMISHKWVLNKKDITIAVAPEQGKDLIIRTVAKRIMQLVEKNHDRFMKANGEKAELNQAEQDLTAQVAEKQAVLKGLQDEVAALQVRKAEKEVLATPAQAEAERLAQEQAAIQTPPLGFVGVWDSKSGQYPFQSITGSKIASFATREEAESDFKASTIQPQEPVTLTGKELGDFEPIQDRPSNWRTNLADARAVAKSLGIETKGKKLDRLVKDVDIFDENEMKKQVLAEFKALASRLVLPTGYAIDLKDAEKSIDNAWMNPEAWIKKQGKVDKSNEIRVELRVVPRASYIANSVHVYAENQDSKKAFDKFDYQRYGDIGGSNPKTPKEIVAKMEDFLTKVIFPAIEYQQVLNSTTLDVVDLPSLGVATITSVGSENIYIEKDGKYYISKVGNPQLYALGEWDFAKYPEGKPAEPVTQPVQTPVVPEPTPAVAQPVEVQPVMPKYINAKDVFLKKANAVYQDMDEMGFNGFAKKVTAIIEDVSNNAEKVDAADKRLEGVVFESKNPLISGEWRDLATGKSYFFENMEYGEVIDTRKEGRRNVIDPWRTTDGEYFESLREAKAHELETYAKQRLIDDGFMQGVKTKDKPQPAIESPTQNPDRDYLQSIIDGEVDPLTVDMDAVIALAEKYEGDADMNPVVDQALEVINQAQQQAAKGI